MATSLSIVRSANPGRTERECFRLRPTSRLEVLSRTPSRLRGSAIHHCLVVGVISLAGCSQTKSSIEPSKHKAAAVSTARPERRVAPVDTATPERGTVLQITCDIPLDAGAPIRSHKACIFWRNRGENFMLPVKPGDSQVQLKSTIPRGERIRIRFTVDEDAHESEGFVPGDWVCGRRRRNASGLVGGETIRVHLSCFKRCKENRIQIPVL